MRWLVIGLLIPSLTGKSAEGKQQEVEVRRCPTPTSGMAPGRGFEPRLTDPESAVLPLDDPGRMLASVIMSRSLLARNTIPQLLYLWQALPYDAIILYAPNLIHMRLGLLRAYLPGASAPAGDSHAGSA